MADTRKTVAIIGAGPSGLSTARSMLARNITPTLFEAKPTIGGLWSSSSAADIIALDQGLTLNHSRYTCSFSDLAWPETAPMFPPVAEMGNYLQRYREKYIPESALRLSCPVTKITKEDDGSWRVEWRDKVKEEDGAEKFDFLAICSGFFSAPYVPPIPGLSSFKGEVIHSADFEKLDIKGKKKIVVVGGSMTGIEAAADIALHLSSQEGSEKPEIVHLFSRPFWNLAKYFAVPNEQDPTAPRFLPLDLLMYDFNARLADAGKPPKSMEEISRAVSEKMKEFVGHDQAELSPEMQVTEKYMNQMPWVAISDSYGSFVREGAIKTVLGRVAAMDGNTVKLEQGEDYSETEITDADTVILATGYHPASSLMNILPEDIYTALTSSSTPIPEDPNFAPLILYNLCLHPVFQQTAGFAGMYKGPYFGIIEMQGRWLAALFSGEVSWPSTEDMTTAITDLAAARTKRIDSAETTFRPQWAAPDYIGVVNDIRERLSIPSAPSATSFFPNTMIPAHFAPASSHAEATKALSDLQSLLVPPTPITKFTAAAVFRGLQGHWSLSRRITSRNSAFPSGTFTGTADFRPREATFTSLLQHTPTGPTCTTANLTHTPLPKTPGGECVEYLYNETGTFLTDTGFTMTGARSYIYRYHPDTDTITVWFVKTDGSGAVDYFFHALEFLPPGATSTDGGSSGDGEVDQPGGWKAKSEHLCVKDWYWPSYRFAFRPRTPDLERFWIRYRVEGPNKDYTAEARYGRP
ncbi:uncharacterized protein LAJ45_09627 [Morchella importuna]|uniref:FAD/NAD(P)-binding domain-containing protein n=1 Tax=Morchella conica CCBAS932 TaxID=1392247 RepID=A0A3N4KK29_9PEZI|nr:uncharacterized protein LAJ45_09627 [Morchella importuna]KAH8146434.1 hypothetical protein LAJ45_09627 [Morchella importuna]RPB09719.1 FAD/NAD(P)-binding domain-containing protein [Morchella conica CCBAS932]